MEKVIYENDGLIGTKENLWKYFKEEIKRQLDDNTIDFETLQDNINNILEVMKQIQENQDIYGNTLLIIKQNNFEDLYYKTLEESD